jgi:glycine cleavage system H protein
VARNETLDNNPELVNTDPYGDGWLFEVAPTATSDLDQLMSAEDYQASLD